MGKETVFATLLCLLHLLYRFGLLFLVMCCVFNINITSENLKSNTILLCYILNKHLVWVVEKGKTNLSWGICFKVGILEYGSSFMHRIMVHFCYLLIELGILI